MMRDNLGIRVGCTFLSGTSSLYQYCTKRADFFMIKFCESDSSWFDSSTPIIKKISNHVKRNRNNRYCDSIATIVRSFLK